MTTRTTFSLDGVWRLRYGPQDAHAPETPAELRRAALPELEVTVPGCVELDLMAAGLLPELERGCRVYEALAYEEYRWWYSRRFAAPAPDGDARVELVFEGLDCLASIWLDGDLLATTDNMLIPHRFDVTDRLREGDWHELDVRLDSAALAGRARTPAPYEQASAPFQWESLDIRKAPHMFGWDILPRIVSAGLWRPVYLEAVPATGLRNVYWATMAVDANRKTATVAVEWEAYGATDAMRVDIALGGRGWTAAARDGRFVVSLDSVDPWWPRGMGDAVLYDAGIVLRSERGAVLDRYDGHIGIRTVHLDRSAAGAGEPDNFRFVVNGEAVFIKGTNWSALDALHARDPLHLDRALSMAADLNCNMVRCWGGSVYEDHAFFDRCDELGLLVWQDFGFACAQYPRTDDFAARVQHEAETVVGRLRNHPSLALWCGGNETDEVYGWFQRDLDPNEDRVSRSVLPDVVARLDPCRDYLPSSPYLSPQQVRLADRNRRPEDHLWRNADFRHPFYTASPARFVSEIGFHGCPGRESLERMLDADALWPWQDNLQWQAKAVRPLPDSPEFLYRVPLMAEVIERFFGSVPRDLDDFILASQWVQAEALKFFVERLRLRKGYAGGILWWNLRDGWPVFSDAVVDYYFVPKLAYFYLRRAQRDVLAMISDAADGMHPVVLVNDTRREARVGVVVRDADSGRRLLDATCDVAANGMATVGQLKTSASPSLWLIETVIDSRSALHHYLCAQPPVALDRYRAWFPKLDLVQPRVSAKDARM